MGSASGCYPLASPGGKLPDLTALRNRYFVVTDEGRRYLKVLDFTVEWYTPEHLPLIQLHSFTNLSPPLISLATLSSFPPGEAKAATPLAGGYEPPLRTQKILAATIQ